MSAQEYTIRNFLKNLNEEEIATAGLSACDFENESLDIIIDCIILFSTNLYAMQNILNRSYESLSDGKRLLPQKDEDQQKVINAYYNKQGVLDKILGERAVCEAVNKRLYEMENYNRQKYLC